MLSTDQRIQQAAAAIRQHWPGRPRAGIVLGTGLSDVAGHLDAAVRLDYHALPHFPRSTAPGHCGQWVCGTLSGIEVVVMDGRCHLYEGYTADQVAFGVRAMHALGIELLIVSNACGGMNPQFRCGDIMIVEDHINLTSHRPARPLKTPTASEPFVINPAEEQKSQAPLPARDPHSLYDPRLVERAMAIANQEEFTAHRGIYVGVTGPNYETRAEYRFFRQIGGDAVGMSTVAEVLAAAECRLRTLALSVVTNLSFADSSQPAHAQQVLTTAAAAEPKVRAIIRRIIEQELPPRAS